MAELLKSRAIDAVAQAARSGVEWQVSETPVDYPLAVAAMESRVAEISAGTAPELVWLLEHPPIYTAGTSANELDLLNANRLPVYRTGRGGQFTYHGPGQRVAYVMLDLKRRKADIRAFVAALEQWIIATLADFGVTGERRNDRIGVWVTRPDRGDEAKIAAIGIRLRRWVSFHGISLNVAPELDHYAGIVPCGVRDHGVTSFADLGVSATMGQVDQALQIHFKRIFEPGGAFAPKHETP